MFEHKILMVDHLLLVERVKLLEKKQSTLSVPIVDEDGERVSHYVGYEYGGGGYMTDKSKNITIREAFDALEEMCGVEITYQEIKGTSKVVIYDKD